MADDTKTTKATEFKVDDLIARQQEIAAENFANLQPDAHVRGVDQFVKSADFSKAIVGDAEHLITKEQLEALQKTAKESHEALGKDIADTQTEFKAGLKTLAESKDAKKAENLFANHNVASGEQLAAKIGVQNNLTETMLNSEKGKELINIQQETSGTHPELLNKHLQDINSKMPEGKALSEKQLQHLGDHLGKDANFNEAVYSAQQEIFKETQKAEAMLAKQAHVAGVGKMSSLYHDAKSMMVHGVNPVNGAAQGLSTKIMKGTGAAVGGYLVLDGARGAINAVFNNTRKDPQTGQEVSSGPAFGMAVLRTGEIAGGLALAAQMLTGKSLGHIRA